MDTLLALVDTNFDDHETRVVALEARTASLPPGVIMPHAGAAAPTGYLLCDGGTYLRASYLDLFNALGGTSSPWGLPSGTEFKVPDLRGRAPMGAGTGANPALTARTIAVGVGAETHALSTAETPSHTHTLSELPHQHNWPNVSEWASGGASSRAVDSSAGQDDQGTKYTNPGVTLNSAGSGTAHNNMQPSLALNFVIKT